MARWRHTKSEENGGREREEGQNVFFAPSLLWAYFFALLSAGNFMRC